MLSQWLFHLCGNTQNGRYLLMCCFNVRFLTFYALYVFVWSLLYLPIYVFFVAVNKYHLSFFIYVPKPEGCSSQGHPVRIANFTLLRVFARFLAMFSVNTNLVVNFKCYVTDYFENSRGPALNPQSSLERPRVKRLDHRGIDSFTFIYTLLGWPFRRAS